MKHIFLTGKIQVGKSTAIQKTLTLLGAKYGGFQTYFCQDRTSPVRRLYLREAGRPPCFDEACAVAQFVRQGEEPYVFTERFDALGAQYVLKSQAAQLTVMDELGDLERGAYRFQEAVLSTLAGAHPVLGVIKQTAGGWVEQVRRHPNVALYTVDEENRDALPEQLARELRAGVIGDLGGI